MLVLHSTLSVQKGNLASSTKLERKCILSSFLALYYVKVDADFPSHKSCSTSLFFTEFVSLYVIYVLSVVLLFFQCLFLFLLWHTCKICWLLFMLSPHTHQCHSVPTMRQHAVKVTETRCCLHSVRTMCSCFVDMPCSQLFIVMLALNNECRP